MERGDVPQFGGRNRRRGHQRRRPQEAHDCRGRETRCNLHDADGGLLPGARREGPPDRQDQDGKDGPTGVLNRLGHQRRLAPRRRTGSKKQRGRQAAGGPQQGAGREADVGQRGPRQLRRPESQPPLRAPEITAGRLGDQGADCPSFHHGACP